MRVGYSQYIYKYKILEYSTALHTPTINYLLKSEVYASLSAMFNPLHRITNQEQLEKHLYNQSNHYEKYERFPLRREAITCYRQTDTFRCQQRRMGYKGGHWYVHDECIVHTAVCQTARVRLKRRRTVKKSSP